METYHRAIMPWNSMLLVITAVLSDSATTVGAMNFSITCDNDIQALYFDGQQVPVASLDWPFSRTFTMSSSIRVIAVSCFDLGGVAGLLASTSDDSVLTNSSWKCATQPNSTQWMSPDYNDTLWPAAVVAAPHSVNDVHRIIPGISQNASWIWTANSGYRPTGWRIDTPVYCRTTIRLTQTCTDHTESLSTQPSTQTRDSSTTEESTIRALTTNDNHGILCDSAKVVIVVASLAAVAALQLTAIVVLVVVVSRGGHCRTNQDNDVIKPVKTLGYQVPDITSWASDSGDNYYASLNNNAELRPYQQLNN